MVEVIVEVPGLPPAKNEAKSILSEGHSHAPRVLELLESVRREVEPRAMPVFDVSTDVGLDVVVRGPKPPSDATNYLGGIGDVIESKAHRQGIGHLGELAEVSLIANDSQIAEVHFRREHADQSSYSIRVWRLNQGD